MTRVRVGAAADIPAGEARQFEIDGVEIAVVNTGPNGFRAVGGLCSHAQAYLHEGEVDVDLQTIECPRHGSSFDLGTGRPRSLPATVPVPVYEVIVEGDDILIEVSDD